MYKKLTKNNLAILLNFLDLTQLLGFFGHGLGFKLIFGFGPELVGPFITLGTCIDIRPYFVEGRVEHLYELQAKFSSF